MKTQEQEKAEQLARLEGNMLKLAEYGKIGKKLAEIAFEGNMPLDVVMGQMSLLRSIAERELKSLELQQECCEV